MTGVFIYHSHHSLVGGRSLKSKISGHWPWQPEKILNQRDVSACLGAVGLAYVAMVKAKEIQAEHLQHLLQCPYINYVASIFSSVHQRLSPSSQPLEPNLAWNP